MEKELWLDLFASHHLLHNKRRIQKIAVSKKGDRAFAVVDIDTLWTRLENGKDFHWESRACKIFTSRLLMTRMENDWTHTHDYYCCIIDIYCLGFGIGLWLLLSDTVLKCP